MVRETVTLEDLRNLVRLGGPLSDIEARRVALRATRDLRDDDLAERLRGSLVEHLTAMVFDHDLGEAIGEDLAAVSISGDKALAVIAQIETALRKGA